MPRVIEELPNGVVVRQVTDDAERLISNIYCERPYSSADGRRFIYRRTVEPSGGDGVGIAYEYLLCEFDTWETRSVGTGDPASTVSYGDDFYFAHREPGRAQFARVDLATGDTAIVAELAADGKAVFGHPTVSPDGRYIAYGTHLSYAPQRFGVEVLNTRTGEHRVVHDDPFICNTHLQWEPGQGRQIMVQHNRGCEFAPDGARLKLLGDEGCTIFLLDAFTGEVTRLPVGPPHTTSLTGHQTWVGETGDIIMTVRPEGDFSPEEGKGNTLIIMPDEDGWRHVACDRQMSHVGATYCGRYFHADGAKEQDIIVGSPVTGRSVLVCHSDTSYSARGFGQLGHPHAYLTSDFRRVVFNSDRTGRPQLYVAELPDGFLDGLEG